MPSLVPGTHVLPPTIAAKQNVDGRDKPGHDAESMMLNR